MSSSSSYSYSSTWYPPSRSERRPSRTPPKCIRSTRGTFRSGDIRWHNANRTWYCPILPRSYRCPGGSRYRSTVRSWGRFAMLAMGWRRIDRRRYTTTTTTRERRRGRRRRRRPPESNDDGTIATTSRRRRRDDRSRDDDEGRRRGGRRRRMRRRPRR